MRLFSPKIYDGSASAPTFVGEAIKAEMFGTNFLFNRDGVDNGNEVSHTYDRYMSETSVSTLRYPGGTMTESLFDLSNPNSPLQSFIEGANPSSATLSLNSFLDYASGINASATIVLPTYRFLSHDRDASGHHVLSLDGDATLRNFLAGTLEEAFQRGVTISAFELGNEWHVKNEALFGFNMTPIEYGRVASYLARVVQEEIDAFRAEHALGATWHEPKVVVQVGPGGAAELYTADGFRPPTNYSGELVRATELIFREFDTAAEQRAVDGLVTHRYLKGEDGSVSGWAYSPFKTWDQLASADGDFKVADRYVTEWNVGADNATELGLKQFDSMVLLFEEMIKAGVDHANVWAVQQRNATRLIENSGIGDETWGGMSFGGLAFDMMSAQLRGQYLMPAKLGSADQASVCSGLPIKL